MSKAKKLRDALQDAGKEGLPRAECVKILGSCGSMSNFVGRGEIIIDGGNVRLNPDYTPARQRKTAEAIPIKRRKKAAKPAKKPRTLREVAERIAAAPTRDNLIISNLIAASQNLRQVIAAQVEGVEQDPLLTGAMQVCERAELLAEAA